MTDEAMRALRLAGRLAAEAGRETSLEDLLAGILAVDDGAAVWALARAGLRERTMRALAATGDPRTEKGPLSSAPVRAVHQEAIMASLREGHLFVGTGHLLLGLARVDKGRAVLRSMEVDVDALSSFVLLAIAERPEHRSLRAQPSTQKELVRRLREASLIHGFTRRQEGAVAEPAAAVGRELWTHVEQAIRPTLAGRSEGKTPHDEITTQREAIALLDAEIERARRALSQLGLDPPAPAASGEDEVPA